MGIHRLITFGRRHKNPHFITTHHVIDTRRLLREQSSRRINHHHHAVDTSENVSPWRPSTADDAISRELRGRRCAAPPACCLCDASMPRAAVLLVIADARCLFVAYPSLPPLAAHDVILARFPRDGAPRLPPSRVEPVLLRCLFTVFRR